MEQGDDSSEQPGSAEHPVALSSLGRHGEGEVIRLSLGWVCQVGERQCRSGVWAHEERRAGSRMDSQAMNFAESEESHK